MFGEPRSAWLVSRKRQFGGCYIHFLGGPKMGFPYRIAQQCVTHTIYLPRDALRSSLIGVRGCARL
jgi:hypothetical protein